VSQRAKCNYGDLRDILINEYPHSASATSPNGVICSSASEAA
jgi:hypothetical protein